ncbi:MAG: septum formation protein Maf [Phycisphaera sp.]|nr:septum formation protein Maf [Phycisphaera sp.]
MVSSTPLGAADPADVAAGPEAAGRDGASPTRTRSLIRQSDRPHDTQSRDAGHHPPAMTHPLQHKRMILASTSPRRIDLLREAGYSFETRNPQFDESAVKLDGLPARHTAMTLAHLKALSVAEEFDTGIIIAGDTLIEFAGEYMGKPKDADDARRMLTSLMGNKHDVITGLSIMDASDYHERMLADTATVRITPIDDDELDAYIESGAWEGKAGGYNVADLEDKWQIHIKGDRTTVIGLPMAKLDEALQKFASEL